jgi:pSer/pThr/pTyr-binding forkhead associated (FHA) protein
MAHLVVYKWDDVFAELTLVDGHEFIVGRAPQCHILLDIETGISRKHLRLYQEGDVWIVECLSRLGNLSVENKSVTKIILENDCQFSVSEFRFEFSLQKKVEQPSVAEENDDAFENSLAPVNKKKDSALTSYTNDSGTQVQTSNLKAFINIKGTETGHDAILELEGHLWVAGRDPSCEIHIDDTHASRKHFEITRIQHEFFITDLASANGTEINDLLLPPHKATKILSGDVIKIQNVTLLLEIRDVNFEQKFEQAKKHLQMIPPPHLMGYPTHYPPHGDMHGVMPIPPPDFSPNGVIEESISPSFDWRKLDRHSFKDFDFKKHKIRVVLGLLAPILLIGLLMDDSPKTDVKEKMDSASQGPSFDSLTEEQRVAVKDMFNLAQQHFHTLKYELCLSELSKLHGIVPNYENSKKLQDFCEQGAILLRQEEDRVALEKKQLETEQRIVTSVEYCRSQPQAMTTMTAAQSCLQEALELSPEHPAILNFLDEIQRREEAVVDEKEDRARAQALRARGTTHFRRANELLSKNALSQALREFDSFIRANYPGLDAEKQQAQRKIASVRSMLEEKVNSLLSECEALRANNKFKEAWKACDQATKEDPNNKRAADLKKQSLSDLRTEMKSIYQDSILEESLGNVDAAKEKWRLIQKNNLEFDDYHKKATRKLQKYGEGI